MSSEEESSTAASSNPATASAIPPVAAPRSSLPSSCSPAQHQHLALHAAAFANFAASGPGSASSQQQLVSGGVVGGGGISSGGESRSSGIGGSVSSSGSSCGLLQQQQSLLKTAVSALGPVKVKRTRQRVDAGEPRNSYASIANFSSTRAAARAQQQLQQHLQHSNFNYNSHHNSALTHPHPFHHLQHLTQSQVLQDNKRARVENIVYNMMQVTGPPASSAADHSALLSSTSTSRNSITSLSSLLGTSPAHTKSANVLSSSTPKSLVMQSTAAAAAAADHLINGNAKDVSSNNFAVSSIGGHNLRSSAKLSHPLQPLDEASEHSLPSSLVITSKTGRQSVSSDRSSSSCSSSSHSSAGVADEASADNQNRDDVTVAASLNTTSGEDQEEGEAAATADETKTDLDDEEKPTANDDPATTGQSPSKSETENEPSASSPKSEIVGKKVSDDPDAMIQKSSQNEDGVSRPPQSRQVNGCKKRKLYQPQQTTAKVMQNVSTEEEEDEMMMMDDDLEDDEEEDEILSVNEDMDEDVDKSQTRTNISRSEDEDEEEDDVASDLSIGKKSASDRLQMFGMRKRYNGEKQMPINLSTGPAVVACGQMTQSQIDQQEQDDMIDADMIDKGDAAAVASAPSPVGSTGSMGSNDESDPLLMSHYAHHQHHAQNLRHLHQQHDQRSSHKRLRVDDQHLHRSRSSATRHQSHDRSSMDPSLLALKAELLENVVKAIEITFEYARRNGSGGGSGFAATAAASAVATAALLPSSGHSLQQPAHVGAVGGSKRTHHELLDQSAKDQQSVGLLARMLESKGPTSNASSRMSAGSSSLRTDDRSKGQSGPEIKTSTPNGSGAYGHHAAHQASSIMRNMSNQISSASSAFPGAVMNNGPVAAAFKNPFPHFLSPMAQNFTNLASALNSRSSGLSAGLDATRADLVSPSNSIGDVCDSGEALSLVLTPKRKRSKVTDTRMTPRTVSRLLGSDPALMNLFARGDLTSSPPPNGASLLSTTTNGNATGHGMRQSSTSPSAPPPPLVPVSLPTSVAIPNPSLHHHHHHENHVSSLFATGAPAFPFTDSRFLFNQQQAAAAAAALHRDRDDDRDHDHHAHHRVDSAAAQHQLNLVRAEQRARAADQALKESQMKEQAAKMQEQQHQLKEQQHHANSAAMAQAVTNALAAHHLSMLAAANQRGSPDSLQGYGSGMFTKMTGSDNGADVSEDTSVNESSLYDSAIPLTATLTPMHLRKAKLMFFYVRYPSSAVLKMFFPDIKFNKNNTAQLVKWFSNFREFYYIQMEKYARQAVAEGIQRPDDIEVPVDAELIRVLNLHYNRNNHIEVPEHFRFVVENTLREFFKSIVAGKDSEQSWKKAIYKIIARLDDSVPEYFKSPTFLDQLE